MGGHPANAWLGLAIPLALLVGCDSAAAPGRSTSHPTPAPTQTPFTPSASPSTAAGGPAVVATVAAATPSGTVIFVVVTNDSTPRVGVSVTVGATSSNGQATVTGTATISALAAGETEATMVRLTVPPNDTIGAVTSAASGTPAPAQVDPLTVAGAVFVPDAIEPTLDITVSATEVVAAKVVAACYQGTTLIGGGVETTVTVQPGAHTTLRLAAALEEKSRRLFGRSLKLREVSAAGCNEVR